MADSKRRKSSTVSANVQWIALSGIALLAVVAVFVFSIGGANSGGGGHSGLADISADAIQAE